jgi:lipopolysaccharide/colanic/teichoic acid biosynthesis glycosyltransferase
VSWEATGDARHTPLGALLRRASLDELPQLWNVVRGDMSLVGPRPEVPAFVAHYSERDRAVLLSVRPGITDLASLRFRNEGDYLTREAEPERAYLDKILPRKLRLARYYVRRRSLCFDVILIWKTVFAALGRPSIREPHIGPGGRA